MVKKTVGVLLRILLFVQSLYLVGFVAVMCVLESEAVQNALIPYVAEALSKTLKTKVRVGRIEIALFDKIVIKDFYVEDEQGEVLLDAGSLKIGVFQVPTLAWASKSNKVKNISVRLVELENVRFNLYRRRRDEKFNIEFIFASDKKKEEKPDTTPGPRIAVDVSKLILKKVHFSLRDSTFEDSLLTPIPGRLNFCYLDFPQVDLSGAFRLTPEKIMYASIHELKTRETRGGIDLKHFSVELQASLDTIPVDGVGPRVRFLNTRFRQGVSDLNFDLTMEGEILGSLFRKGRNRKFVCNFRPSVIDFNSINAFFPRNVSDLPLKGVARAEGLVEGDYTKIKSRRLRLRYNKDTDVLASVRLNDFTKPDKLFLEANILEGKIDPHDLELLLPNVLKLPEEVKRLGVTRTKAKFTGFIKDFVANGTFVSKLGTIDCDINIKIAPGHIAYEGKVATDTLNLDAVLGTKVSDRLTLKAKVNGVNFDYPNAKAEVEVEIQKSKLTKYSLDTVRATIRLDGKKINGQALVLDAEGNFDARVALDFSGPKPRYELLGNVQNLDLRHYGVLPQKPYRFSTIFNIDLRGDSLDNIEGLSKFYLLQLERAAQAPHDLGDTLAVKNIVVRSERNSIVNKNLNIRSELLDFDMTGNFSYQQALAHIKRLIKEGELFFKNDSAALHKYYASLHAPKDSMRFTYDLNALNINPILDFFQTGLYVAPNSDVGGRFAFGALSSADIYLHADSLRFGEAVFREIKLDTFHLRKPAMENKPEAAAALYCREVFVNKSLNFQNIRIAPAWAEEQIRYEIAIDQDSLKNKYRLAGEALFRQSAVFVHFDSLGSYFSLGDSVWRFSHQNDLRYAYAEGEMQIDNFRLTNDIQEISISSNIVKGVDDKLSVFLKNVNIGLINHFARIEAPFSGKINAEILVRRIFAEPVVQLNGSAMDFRWGDAPYGDITARSDWDDKQQILNLALRLSQKGDTLIRVGGFYDVKDKVSPLNFTISANNLPLSLAEPFVKGVLYDLDGTLNVKGARLHGKALEPKLEGRAQVDAELGVTYFQTKHAFKGEIVIDENAFHFREQRIFNIIDDVVRPERSALLNGALVHNRFTDVSLQFTVRDLQNFFLINTKKTDNALYYGALNLTSGSATITGRLAKLLILANAEIGKGTVFNIPVTGYHKKQRLDYVTFTGGYSDAQTPEKKKDAIGLDMKLTVNATPDAAVNIIFDEKVGDKISGRGRGTINLDISTDGSFSMDGQYEITEGDYLFTFRNILNKKFLVEPGGTINWTGDPYNARLDIKAIFRVENANLKTWDSTQTQTVNLDVVMGLKGSLLSPEITFALETPAGAQLTYNVQSTLRMIQNDPQELNRQVFSLLMLRSVTPIGKFFGGSAAGATSGGVSSSMTEFLSAQLNNLISQTIDKNLNVSVGFNKDVLLLNLKASMLNDRVTIERNGAIVGNSGRDLTLGNITVQIKLVPGLKRQITETSGRLSLEIFNRENVTSQALATTTRGVGVFFRKDFNKLSDLFYFIFPKRKDKTQNAPTLDNNKR